MKCNCGKYELVRKNRTSWKRHVDYESPGKGVEHTKEACVPFNWK